MSKMSQLHAELSEQAYELGFENLEQAFDNGYEVISDGDFAHLVRSEDEQESAHKDYEKRKEEILDKLRDLREAYRGVENTEDVLSKAIDFIKEGEV